MPTSTISIERDGRLWAIKHNGGFLGHVRSEAEAWSLARALAAPGEAVQDTSSPPAACDGLRAAA